MPHVRLSVHGPKKMGEALQPPQAYVGKELRQLHFVGFASDSAKAFVGLRPIVFGPRTPLGERGAPVRFPLTSQFPLSFAAGFRLRQIFLQERIVTMHQIMRRAIENDMPVMQDKEIRLRIQPTIRNGNHVVLFAVEGVRGEHKGILQTMRYQQ